MRLMLYTVELLPTSWIKFVARLRWRYAWLSPAILWYANQFKRQDGVIQRGVGQGLRFNAGGANAGYLFGTTEPKVQVALAAFLKAGMTFYDVGANVGFFSIIAARIVGPKGRVISFEPLPDNADQIESNAVANQFDNVMVRREALSDKDGQSTFLVSEEPTWCKLSRGDERVNKQIAEMTVPVARLDTLISRDGLSTPDVIKIDVEGAEKNVLDGAAHLIRRARPVLLIELHGTNRDIEASLADLAYRALTLDGLDAISDARWDAYVIAVPQERDDLYPMLHKVCG